jgi:putative ABC transport system substrate-binding protein
MNRRTVLCGLALGTLSAPFAAEAESTRRIHRIGVLDGGSDAAPGFAAFRQGLRELGYVEGDNLLVEHRSAEGKPDRLPQLAADLVRLKVDVIVAVFATPARAAHQATPSIPIVMIAVGDPVGISLAASLARPGGNVTGTVSFGPELATKSMQLLKEILPDLKRLRILWNPSNPAHAPLLKNAEPAARSLAIELQTLPVTRADEFEGFFRAAARQSAAWILGDALAVRHRDRLATLAAEARLPTMFLARLHVEAGGLMSYGPHFPTIFWRSATYVDKVLKGTRPADLPIEQPTKFELVINLKTAKALGLTIPPSLLLRADHVIE